MDGLVLDTDGMQEMSITIKAKPQVTEYRRQSDAEGGEPLF